MQRSGQSRWTKLKFSKLGVHPASFLDILSLGICLFGIVDRIFHFGAKHSQNLEKLELENGRIIELVVISPFSVVSHGTPSLVLFVATSSRLNKESLVPLFGIATYLPSSFTLFVTWFIRRSKRLSWVCFRRCMNLMLRFDIIYVNHQDPNFQWTIVIYQTQQQLATFFFFYYQTSVRKQSRATCLKH